MKIVEKRLTSLKPYENNPRNNDSAVSYVANSIKEFGFKVPIIIDKDNVIIAGHTRYKACKLLGIKTVPCIVADDLTDEQVKAFRLADNKVSEAATWDTGALEVELNAILGIDMEAFDFHIPGFDNENDGTTDFEEDYAVATQHRVENILNLGFAQFEGDGRYDIPQIAGIKTVPEVREWIGFNYVLSDKDPAGKGVHFFVDDYQFERVWNEPDRYIEKLSQYEAVLSPDFSPYGDMPWTLQLFNHYRKHWCAAYWQMHGITVIPTIRSSTDYRSELFFLEGEPTESVIAISTMWDGYDKEANAAEYETIVDELNPSHILVYGHIPDYMDPANVTRIPAFTEKYKE